MVITAVSKASLLILRPRPLGSLLLCFLWAGCRMRHIATLMGMDMMPVSLLSKARRDKPWLVICHGLNRLDVVKYLVKNGYIKSNSLVTNRTKIFVKELDICKSTRGIESF